MRSLWIERGWREQLKEIWEMSNFNFKEATTYSNKCRSNPVSCFVLWSSGRDNVLGDRVNVTGASGFAALLSASGAVEGNSDTLFTTLRKSRPAER